ncbi:1,4-alpha-glucan branching enzyme [Nitrosomonas eutropha]|uniref:1,4-alpha-glucan branching enzyme GlgB n=3 Tax=Nitrosomonas TaxID=914 RepID=GLGB_NITEC|nr:1,4-alpha-glucan branching protein GlgB [Nitrosomonas sp. GH22]Q0AGJ0.1 RecName: Full=1,4-alpha-glucan branching enzyme GlgB; AltName: Full=1,4-alpha-D-glucan:1,4-alpha-D-glucan 6-glucosyl-transferase; AltName: Full=Alpha-(1->4)-glucan branching enzyme; AltName: Full=Glycogen branching enzyme; Short=BE [Nitrosomonas eutropha C91]PXV76110.1 1,4-alpha-glucan branching enzyme [Nitrosomonas eutropha]ABI59542.1 1,4-alpha-glucan branching enzyme [Nitrosomonas eutropha C91]MXS79919.1 1,4-alpha-gluc
MKSLPFPSPSRDLAGDSAQSLLLAARLHAPGSYLGIHSVPGGELVRVFQPYMSRVWLQTSSGFQVMECTHDAGIFEWKGEAVTRPYLLRLEHAETGVIEERYDPYAFPVQISGHDLYLFNEGRLLQAYHMLGTHQVKNQGVTGTRFAVWAPNAERVSVVGDFNHWDGRVCPMMARDHSGVWELFIPDLPGGTLYKYEIRNHSTGEILLKTDPYATRYELRPNNAALTPVESRYEWQDNDWMVQRAGWDWLHAPVNIYELHVGSWKRHPDGSFYSYQELADHLIPYLQEMGYSHVELLPISEHPLDESWGYQVTGYFAATSRYGNPEAFMYFVDKCHQAGIGVILDWVPAHFPQDSFSLARFDGTALYEHEDPRLGYHQDWGTYIFNYGRSEVKSFLLSSAHYWLSVFHIDGLRVDAVASMLYLDYSRKEGEWLPNRFGGRENLDAIDFLRELNTMVHGEFSGALTFAEESTSWPAVSRPTYLGGLGFSMKWNMGWMNDTLNYMQLDPIHRHYHHNELTFNQLYAYTENFILPLSHDEVVHGKKSLLDKMSGDVWQMFANLRLLFTYQMTCPGKKINFMGNEFAQGREWRVNHELDWYLLERDPHRGIQMLLRNLNHLYLDTPALHELDFFTEGFSWIDCHDSEQSVISYQRRARDGSFMLVILNFTPVPRTGYRVGVPESRTYQEVFNSDSTYYGGSNIGNPGDIVPTGQQWSGQVDSIIITLPPLAGIILI